MAAIDDEIERFFSHMASLSWDIEDDKDWARKYESKRYSYPEWVTKDGQHIKIYNIEDKHLNNLISYLDGRNNNKKDSDKKAIKWWLSLFECEKKYRDYQNKQKEYAYMESVRDKVF